MKDNKKGERRATGLRTSTAAVDLRDREGTRFREGHGGKAHEPRRDNGAIREEIARRAHELYLARGGGDGRDVEDWLRAEAEVLARRASD